jgi:hypothetical protein
MFKIMHLKQPQPAVFYNTVQSNLPPGLFSYSDIILAFFMLFFNHEIRFCSKAVASGQKNNPQRLLKRRQPA